MASSRTTLIAALFLCGVIFLTAVPVIQKANEDLEFFGGESWLDSAKSLLAKVYAPVQAVVDAVTSKITAIFDKVVEVDNAMNSAAGSCKTAHDTAETADNTVGETLESASGLLGAVVEDTMMANLQSSINEAATTLLQGFAVAPGTAMVDLEFFESVVAVWNTLSSAVKEKVQELMAAVKSTLTSGLENLKDTLDTARRELYETRITAKVAMEKSEFARGIVEKIKEISDKIRDTMGLAKPQEGKIEGDVPATADLQEAFFFKSAAEKVKEWVEYALAPVRNAFSAARAKIDGAAQEADELEIASGFVQRKAVWAQGLVEKVQAALGPQVQKLVDWLSSLLPEASERLTTLLQNSIAESVKTAAAKQGKDVTADVQWLSSVTDKVKEITASMMEPIYAKIKAMRDKLVEIQELIKTAISALASVDLGMGVTHTTVSGFKAILDRVRSDASINIDVPANPSEL